MNEFQEEYINSNLNNPFIVLDQELRPQVFIKILNTLGTGFTLYKLIIIIFIEFIGKSSNKN